MALQRDLTEGRVGPHLVKFALPLIVSNVFQALYNAVDMFFVGRFAGTAGLSAVSTCGPIMNIMIMTVSGLSVGVTVVIGLRAGHGAKDEIKNTANTAIALYALLSLAATVLGFIAAPLLLRLVNTPESAFGGAVLYLRTIFCGITFMFGYNLICAFQRGFGDSRTSMLFIVIACAMNVLLDYVLIGVLKMGPFGAALATVASQAASFIMGIAYFRLKKHLITFRISEIRVNASSLGTILRMGLPSAAHQLLLNVSMVALSGIANSFGLSASAAYGVGIKIDSFALLPSDAMNASLSAFVSQNVGAGREDRARKSLSQGLKLVLIIAGAVMATVWLGAPALASVFGDDQAVNALAVQYLRVACLSYPFFGMVYACTGFIRGTGNVMVPLLNVVFSQYVVRIPIALVCTHFFGFVGVAFAVIGGPLFSTCSYLLYIRSGKWRMSREIMEGRAD